MSVKLSEKAIEALQDAGLNGEDFIQEMARLEVAPRQASLYSWFVFHDAVSLRLNTLEERCKVNPQNEILRNTYVVLQSDYETYTTSTDVSLSYRVVENTDDCTSWDVFLGFSGAGNEGRSFLETELEGHVVHLDLVDGEYIPVCVTVGVSTEN